MTKKEAIRQSEQERALMSLGFTSGEAEQLRRISMTLHRWHEGECGDAAGTCIVRGRMNGAEFECDDDGDAYREFSGFSGRARYSRIPDREKGAIARLKAIIAARNIRAMQVAGIPPTFDIREPEIQLAWHRIALGHYIQTDPRGAALYIIRPGDVPEGADVSSYYTRGICVY